ncbi:LytR/AlgR family response regulator transcription factor [Holdemania massiliensis]|uniref:LytR/AlgR family response regulator transcription factor n=1 Tax=Holdemania massiliensis TaxID=1468449 RepID=UPI001F0657AC|nr:LytTR family DNA-binding domain-containing protein [Holdemania massiliensis]MCH1940128.1 LytTR family DNA-binding domain-containing protein [Holdemania massiliensis]
MIQMAICDDEAKEREKLSSMVLAYGNRHPEWDSVVYLFASGKELVDSLEAGNRYDIYLLDILMPDKNGIELASEIRKRDAEAVLIFLSSSEEFGVKAYRVRAYDYLVKPVDSRSLFHTLDELRQQILENKTDLFPIKTKTGIQPVHPVQLMYVEYQNHKCYYHLAEGEIIESATMRQPFDEIIQPLLADRRFVKSTVAYLVNMAYIQSIEGRSLLLPKGICLPVSRSEITEVRKRFMSYLLERGRGR